MATNENDIPDMAMEVLAILYSIKSHTLPIAHTATTRKVQTAVEWLQSKTFIEFLGDDLWKITESGDRFFSLEMMKTA